MSTTNLIKHHLISFRMEVSVGASAIKDHLKTLNTDRLSIVKKLCRS